MVKRPLHAGVVSQEAQGCVGAALKTGRPAGAGGEKGTGGSQPLPPLRYNKENRFSTLGVTVVIWSHLTLI